MDNRPIGVFDSGLGGLTAVKELMRQLPEESIVYFGDTGRVPYGTRSNEIVTKYVFQDIRFLLNFDIKLIIIACGTASSIALEAVQKEFAIPIIGVVHSAAAQAAKISTNKKIGIIGTQGTINSNSYVRKINEIDPSIKTFSKACPLFVPLVENGYLDNEVARLVAKEYLEPLKQESVDTIIMGCTHYPLLRKTIADIMGQQVSLVDPGAETARYVKEFLQEKDMLAEPGNKPEYRYFVSDSVESFSRLGSLFLEKEIIQSVEKIDIEKY
ncbi:MAG: glutamate racemase [Clostridia bacterium]|jgi:glutamate racemase|uniref:glutamate racemase n=1 Tax=Petroclostridium xylanilyticum TaxID=1792311 RepID=UPI000B99BE26|nr:glutamate racemase [Petroclostridium xylanilyticum]MBZ4645145.1 glutamate racemase [Clostridia bacterium]